MRERERGLGGHPPCSRADVSELPLEVLLKRLETLKGDFELVWSIEGRGVVAHAHVEDRDRGHGRRRGIVIVLVCSVGYS